MTTNYSNLANNNFTALKKNASDMLQTIKSLVPILQNLLAPQKIINYRLLLIMYLGKFLTKGTTDKTKFIYIEAPQKFIFNKNVNTIKMIV